MERRRRKEQQRRIPHSGVILSVLEFRSEEGFLSFFLISADQPDGMKFTGSPNPAIADCAFLSINSGSNQTREGQANIGFHMQPDA